MLSPSSLRRSLRQKQCFCSLMLLLLVDNNNNNNNNYFVSGFRNSATSCASGTEALLQTNQIMELQTHGITNQVGTGPISDYGLQILLDGIPITSEESDNNYNNFTYGEDHILSLVFKEDDSTSEVVSPSTTTTTELKFFRGFLIRMEAMDGETETFDSFFIDSDPQSIQLVDSCENESPVSVAGVSHTNNNPKQHANVTLNLDVSFDVDVKLDVTVVIEMNVARNMSHWYYSQFDLKAIQPENLPTTNPTISPSPTVTPPTPSDEQQPTTTEMPATGTTTPEPTVASSSAYSLTFGRGSWMLILFCLNAVVLNSLW